MPFSPYDAPAAMTLDQIIAKEKENAKDCLTRRDAENVALRCALRALLTLLNQFQTFLQANVTAGKLTGSVPNVPNWSQAVAAIQNQITNNDNDPTT